MPKCCHNRNQGLCASISSCLRLAAEMSLALSGLISGASNISSSCSISSMMRSTSMGLNHLVESGNRSNGSRILLSESFIFSQSTCQRPQPTHAALANGHRVPCGHEQNTPRMPRRRLCSDGPARSDVLLREEPDEEEDDEEDEGNVTDDEGDDDEEDDGGYSVRVCRLCQW